MQVHAPFTPEQVRMLNTWQVLGIVHPFTCTCGANLVAAADGWHCERCPYTQDWAHGFMVDVTAISHQKEIVEAMYGPRQWP